MKTNRDKEKIPTKQKSCPYHITVSHVIKYTHRYYILIFLKIYYDNNTPSCYNFYKLVVYELY
jgi:hypothetical protein